IAASFCRPGSNIGSLPRFKLAILGLSMSKQMTSWPISAKQTPDTRPTYPVPTTPIRITGGVPVKTFFSYILITLPAIFHSVKPVKTKRRGASRILLVALLIAVRIGVAPQPAIADLRLYWDGPESAHTQKKKVHKPAKSKVFKAKLCHHINKRQVECTKVGSPDKVND